VRLHTLDLQDRFLLMNADTGAWTLLQGSASQFATEVLKADDDVVATAQLRALGLTTRVQISSARLRPTNEKGALLLG
jgi:hypothetical protein